jgi:NitT/TauT family transport system substrate-binding protein
MKIKKIIILIITLIIIVGIIFIANINKDKTEDVLKIGYRSHVFYAPLFIAMEKGYFNDYGIKVEPIEFESTNQLIEAMLADRVDAALGGINTFSLFNVEEKTPGSLKIFSIASESPDNPSIYLLVKKDSDIKRATDLENKTIGLYLGSAVQIFYRKFIAVNNLKNTKFLQMDPKLELQALESEQVDAILAIEPDAAIGSQKGISTPLESAVFDKYFLKNIPISGSVVRDNLVNSNPELVKKLVQITQKASQFINEHPDEAKLILVKYTPITEDIASQVGLPMFDDMSEKEKQKLEELKAVLQTEGEIEGKADVNNMILQIK